MSSPNATMFTTHSLSGGAAERLFELSVRQGSLTLWHDEKSPLSKSSEQVLELLQSSANPDPRQVTIFKRFRRRSIFSCDLHGMGIVVKAFPFDRLKDSWRWRRYAPTEVCRHLHAASHGISTPRCFGWFRIRRFGRVVNCGLLMEELRAFADLGSKMQLDVSQCRHAIPVLAEFYRRGVYHHDLNPCNIFMPYGAGSPVIIDWQRSSFHQPRQRVHLLAQAAHFLNYAGIDCRSSVGEGWVNDLHRACECDGSMAEFANEVAATQQTTRRPGDSFAANTRLKSAA